MPGTCTVTDCGRAHYSNAVTPPASRDLIAAVAASIEGQVAA